MVDNKSFSLPKSGYEILAKILHAYVLCGNGKIAIDDVVKKSGLGLTMVSRNNAFFVGMGILDSGREKSLTPIGKKLAVAIGNSLVQDIRDAWKELVLANPTTRSLLDMIKVQKGVEKSELPSKIASTLNVVIEGGVKTGVNAVIDILEKSGLIELDGGKFIAMPTGHPSQPEESSEPKVAAPIINPNPPAESPEALPPSASSFSTAVHIDLNIHISPESSSDQIDQIFKSIAQHLKK